MGIAALPGVNRSTRSITTAWQRMTVAINSIITPRLASSSCGGCRSLRRHRYSFCLRPEWEAICCKALAQGNREVAMATTFSATQEGDVISDHRLIAQVLREAFPYIDFLKGKTLVIKLGGSTLEHQRFVLEDITWLRALGASPVLVHARIADERLGFVGEIESVDPTLVQTLIDQEYIPVIAPLGQGPGGSCLNINADLVAAHLAGALHAEKLIFLSNVSGICDAHGSLISELKEAEAKQLIADGIISGGMIPKVAACLDALVTVPRVHIVDGRVPHVLLRELFTDRGAGTMIVRNDAP